MRHKFRATFGSSKVLKKDSTVLVLVDGSPESLVMLDMIKVGLDEDVLKKFYVNVAGVLFVDDLFLEISNDKRRESLEELKERLNYLNMTLLYASVADKETFSSFDERTFDESAEENFTSKLNQLKSLTSQQDFVRLRKNETASYVAESLGCSFILSPEISTELAKKLLTSVALGRGASVAQDVAFSDERYKILRPLRDISPIEVHHYLKLSGLKTITLPQFGQSRGEASSLQNLTAGFVDGLQNQFVSTVSTVFKTGDKLKQKNFGLKKFCKMCKAEVDCQGSETLFAVEYSRVVSTGHDPQFIEEKAKKAVDGADNFRKDLCHGCRNIFLDVSDSNDEVLSFIS